MGITKSPRPSAAVKDLTKRFNLRDRPQVAKAKQTSTPLPTSPGAKAPKSKSLASLFDSEGLAWGASFLRTKYRDAVLRRKLFALEIQSKEGVETAMLDMLFHSRNLKDWDAGGDDLVDVFRLIHGRISWAAGLPLDLFMELFFALLRARLNIPRHLRNENTGKIARRVDQVISYINGVDHLLSEYDIYENLAAPIHHAIRKLPKKAKSPGSAVPGAIFVRGISSSKKSAQDESFLIFEDFTATGAVERDGSKRGPGKSNPGRSRPNSKGGPAAVERQPLAPITVAETIQPTDSTVIDGEVGGQC